MFVYCVPLLGYHETHHCYSDQPEAFSKDTCTSDTIAKRVGLDFASTQHIFKKRPSATSKYQRHRVTYRRTVNLSTTPRTDFQELGFWWVDQDQSETLSAEGDRRGVDGVGFLHTVHD
jgi:hypothetical protein